MPLFVLIHTGIDLSIDSWRYYNQSRRDKLVTRGFACYNLHANLILLVIISCVLYIEYKLTNKCVISCTLTITMIIIQRSIRIAGKY